VFERQSLVLFSHESGTFFYSAGKLYEYKIEDNAVVATLIFQNLPCTGVVNVMRERTTGDYFISTRSEGIYRVKKKRFRGISLVNASAENTIPNPEGSNIIYSISFMDPQHIVANGYLSSSTTGTAISSLFAPVDKNILNLYFSYKKDSTHLWINYNDSLQSFDTRTASLTSLQQMSDVKKVIDLTSDTKLILTVKQILLWQNGHATEVYRNDTARFSTMEKVSENCLIVGSGTGLHYYFPAENRLQPIPYLQAFQARSIYKDRAGSIWVTSYGSGLFHVTGNKIQPLPLDNAGHLAISHSIMEDNSGNFWISTNHGLFKVAYSSLLSIIHKQSNKLFYNYFDKTDGFNTNEFNGGCYPSGLYQAETGKMFFPSMDGIVTFSPDSIETIESNKAVFFDEVVLNDTHIRLHFSSPYYGQASNIKFSYSLSSAPEQWNDLGGNRIIELNNLSGGNYTLTIKKEESTGTPMLTTFRFQIPKLFSETIWFKLLLLAVIIGLVFLYFKARLLYLSKERQRLEKEVAARTADQLHLIQQLKDTIIHLTQVQQELSQMIGHKENIIAILIHDIKSPLHFLNAVSDHLAKHFTTNPPAKNKQIITEIAASLNRLYLFTQDFAIWLHASAPNDIQSCSKVNISQAIDESLAVYNEIITKKELSITRQIHIEFIYGDIPMIKSILRNLLDNAIKNTTTGRITITARVNPDEKACEILIADEGKGLTRAQLEELNHYLESDQEILSFSSSQFGHKVIKDFIRKLNGSILYHHNNPAGIIVTVTLPTGHEDISSL
jgi:signal transduction histidine kinase